MSSIQLVLLHLFFGLRRRVDVVRTRLGGQAGEVVTWVILAAGLAIIAVSVVVAIGIKLRNKINGIELQ